MNISELSSTELLNQLNSGSVSILKELGANNLRLKNMPAGRLCCILANILCTSSDTAKLRKKTSRALHMITPSVTFGDFPEHEDAIVIGFNHPSLGEIFRLISLGFDYYPERQFLFPVNLAWYESLVPVIGKISSLGITVTPMVTPSIEAKLKKQFEGNEEKYKEIQHFKTLLERRYMRIAREFAENNGIIFVAPSTTRQTEIIGEHIHPTMTILAHMIFRKSDSNASFLPVAVVLPENGNRLMNLFRKYAFCPCKLYSSAEVKSLTKASRDFDLIFLKEIEKNYLSTKQKKLC